ncbi:MAG: DUF4143 domain-containing protein [Candidatus Aminicenantes bacterium]|nr:DUF4143 domain-containing protein [Candidatus Aminicenantes bacterium]
MELVSRFFEEPDQSFFLFGPRGTGKSTWVSAAHKDALTVNLLEPEIYRAYSARPERLGEAVRANPGKTVIAIDEIQKVPSLLDMVHQLIEETPGRKFILTGSSARKLKRAGVDLLAGRALLKTMHPFLAAELGAKFDLDKALLHGLLPLAVGSPNPRDVLAGYAALYLKEEVQAEGLIRNVGQFARFLEAISFSHGSILNVSNIARDCEIERKTVESYIQILEDLLLAFRLPVFTKRAKRKTTEHPKFFLFDTGVFRALRPRGPLDKPQEIEGPALEGLVAQHLRAWNAYDGERHELCFWRTRGGAEVDFVVHGERGLWAIEVKNDRKARDEDLRYLRSFLQDYPEARAILLYRGKERLLRNGVLCLPCGDFLKNLAPGKSPDEGL